MKDELDGNYRSSTWGFGGVCWTTDSPEKIYDLYRKGDDGEVLQELEYIDDKVQPAI